MFQLLELRNHRNPIFFRFYEDDCLAVGVAATVLYKQSSTGEVVMGRFVNQRT